MGFMQKVLFTLVSFPFYKFLNSLLLLKKYLAMQTNVAARASMHLGTEHHKC